MMKASRKGISPLVAVIMLIGTTLVVGGVMAIFVTQLTQGELSTLEVCKDARVILKRGVYDESNQSIALTVHNYGKVPLKMQVILTYSNETLHPTREEIYEKETFDIEEEKITLFNVADVTDDLVEVTVKSIDCDEPCYKCAGAQDFLKYIDIKGIGY